MSERIFLKVSHRPLVSLRIDFNILLCSFRAFNQQAAADSPKAERTNHRSLSPSIHPLIIFKIYFVHKSLQLVNYYSNLLVIISKTLESNKQPNLHILSLHQEQLHTSELQVISCYLLSVASGSLMNPSDTSHFVPLAPSLSFTSHRKCFTSRAFRLQTLILKINRLYAVPVLDLSSSAGLRAAQHYSEIKSRCFLSRASEEIVQDLPAAPNPYSAPLGWWGAPSLL